jgi:putative ABC transport system permease protein
MNDLKYAIRQLLKHKGSTLLAVVILALGIGGTTAVYSVANKVLLNPIPGRETDRLVSIREVNTVTKARWQVSPPLIQELALQTNLIDSLTHFLAFHDEKILRVAGKDLKLRAASVAPNFFELLELRPLIGSARFADDESATNGPEIVLGYGFWQRHYGGDRQVVGRDLELDGTIHTVIGVMPANVQFPFGSGSSDFWIPRRFTADEIGGDWARENRMWLPILKLQPGVDLTELQSWLEVLALRRQAEINKANERWIIDAKPARLTFGGEMLQKTIWSLLAMMGALLLIACANVGNLLLSRSLARQGEFSVRMAIGAGRLRIARQLLVESLVLAGLSAALGVFVAWGGIKALEQFYLSQLPRINVIGLDWGVLGIMALLAVLVGILFGTAPAWLAARINVSRSLKESARQHGGGVFQRAFHDGLVVTQVSLAVVLLLGAGVMTQSVVKLLQVEPGLEAKGLYRVLYGVADFMNQRLDHYEAAIQRGLSRPEAIQVAWQARVERFLTFERLALERLRAVPGIESAAVNGGSGGFAPYEIEGRPEVVTLHGGDVSVVHGDYLRTVKAKLISGRLLDRDDAVAGQQSVVINQHMAEVCWPGENPLGKRFRRPDPFWEYQVVGVVADIVDWQLEAAKKPYFYEPYERNTKTLGSVGDYVVRSSLEPAQLRTALEQAGREMMVPVEIRDSYEIEAQLMRSTAPRQVMMWLLVSLGGLGILLSAMGVYAVLSFAVARRTHEIGVRMAVGARREQIHGQFLRQGLRLIANGLVLGIVLAITVAQYTESLLHGAGPNSPWVFATVILTLLVAGGFACWLPARRAAKTDPMTALRME